MIKSKESTAKIAKDLDVNAKTLYNWVREYKKVNNIPVLQRGYAAAKSKSRNITETAKEEAKILRVKNKLLKQERDILKKATAYFAKEVL